MSIETSNELIEDESKHIIEMSDRIWSFAELGLVEYKSSKLISDELAHNGFKVKMGVASMPTAFYASWGSGRPVIGIMGEYDALPGLSQRPVAYKSPLINGGAGHGCGHNIHGVSGMAAAIAAKIVMEANELKGTLRYFGCPAEETDIGKVFMVRDGVFEGVDACLSHHPSQINTASLQSSTATIQARFVFKGTSSHAAGDPESGRSSLDAVELMNVGVNYLREHIIEKARIHYIIEDGGEVPNVVPPYASSWYFVRAPKMEQASSIYERIIDIAKGAAIMSGTKRQVKFVTAISNKIPNRTLAEIVVRNMREIGAPEFNDEELAFAHDISQTFSIEKQKEVLRGINPWGIRELNKLEPARFILDPQGDGESGAGSTDVSDVSWNAPTMEFETTCATRGTPGHSWQKTAQSGMSIGHKGLIFATKTMSACIIDLLMKPDLLHKARMEFLDRTREEPYKSPLPRSLKPPLKEAEHQAKVSIK